MNSITINGLDENIKQFLKKEAEKDGVSISEKVRSIITESINFQNTQKSSFSEFYGLWDESDYQEFKQDTAEFNEINDIDWK